MMPVGSVKPKRFGPLPSARAWRAISSPAVRLQTMTPARTNCGRNMARLLFARLSTVARTHDALGHYWFVTRLKQMGRHEARDGASEVRPFLIRVAEVEAS